MSSVAASRLTAHRSPATRRRQLLLGPPLATSRLVAERLRKVVATGLALPIALGIGALLAILILSYRQTITAYPSSGGAYVVSRDNFGPRWALVAGSALLIDYVLTVAVSVTSGVAALTTAVPPLQRLVLPLSPAAIELSTWTNLRGVRESGRIAFRPPEARNARRTLAAMRAILGSSAAGHAFFADFPRLMSFAAADAFPGGSPSAASGWSPLEAVHCPNRDLVDCATDAVAGRARLDTEVTVLLPSHGDQSGFRRLLHDQTGRNLFAALNRLDGVKVAVVHPPAHHPVVP
jgi:hypothetical protein